MQAAGRWWYGNCAWDAFGICAALHSDGRIETSCPDCGEPLAVEVRGERPDDESLLFHCPVPAAHWWDDRLAPDWQPHTREQNMAILGGLGLTGEFWTLA